MFDKGLKTNGDETTHWAHVMCDPEYELVPTSYSQVDRISTPATVATAANGRA